MLIEKGTTVSGFVINVVTGEFMPIEIEVFDTDLIRRIERGYFSDFSFLLQPRVGIVIKTPAAYHYIQKEQKGD